MEIIKDPKVFYALIFLVINLIAVLILTIRRKRKLDEERRIQLEKKLADDKRKQDFGENRYE